MRFVALARVEAHASSDAIFGETASSRSAREQQRKSRHKERFPSLSHSSSSSLVV